ncbi:MAG: hypothetical protein ABFS41_11485 [Myxococcota bacterium]
MALRMAGSVRYVTVAVFLLGSVGCGSAARKAAWELGLGSFATDLSVVRVVPRGAYLDATLVGHGLSLEVYTPRDAACSHVLEPEGQVDYVERGVAGRLERDGASCDAIGIGGSRIRRARQPRGAATRASVIPRAQASFRETYRDDEVILLRGRFPLASQVGFGGGGDAVAVVPNEARCTETIERGVASMEYRPAGRTTLSLVGKRGLCPIIGLIQPLGPPAPAP